MIEPTSHALFSGLKVLDLSSVLAGPSVATFFAELGAEVVKVENKKTNGDVTRKWKLPQESDTSISAYFASVNYNKKYLYKDLTLQADFKEIMGLATNTDILISNFKEGDAEKFGLTYEHIRNHNPRIIYAKLGGFIDQPHRIAYDVVLQAETGFMSMNGTPDTGPLKMPVALIDVLAAHQLKEGILCGLLRRANTGFGCQVECNLEASAISSLSNQASNYLMVGQEASLQGSIHPNIAPYGETFICSDMKALVLAVGSDKQFQALCSVLEKALLAQDARFENNPQRVIHREILKDLIQECFLEKTREDWMHLFQLHAIPAGAILSLSEVLNRTEVKAMILEEEIQGTLTRRIRTVAFHIRD